VALDWNASTGATRYYVYYGTSATTATTSLGYVTSPGVTIYGFSANTTYYFAVKAYDSKGYSGYSTVIGVKTN